MSFSDFLYASLNNFGTIFCYWVVALIALVVISVVLLQFFSKPHPLTYLPEGAGISVFFGGLLFFIFLLFASVMALAPASWFARLPANEVPFFKENMELYHGSLSVLDFISIQENYASKNNPYNSLIAQKRALK